MVKKYQCKKIGEKFTTNEGYKVEVVDGGSKSGYCTILFLTEIKCIIEVQYSNLKNGEVKNPYHSSICHIGYLGIGDYSPSIGRRRNPIYSKWVDMIRRCYDKEWIEKHNWYDGYIICDEWREFQSFAKWATDRYVYGFELDKDLKRNENKVYSPETCIFIPSELNLFLTNKQKNNKSGYIGVSYCNTFKKYMARINDFRISKYKNLGYYKTAEDASIVYNNYRKELSEAWRIRARSEFMITDEEALDNIM